MDERVSIRSRTAFFIALGLVALSAQGQLAARPARRDAASARAASERLTPIFIANDGQFDAAARFVSVGGGRPIFFTDHDVRIVDPARQRSVWLSFVGGEPTTVEGDTPTGASVTYLSGARPARRLLAYRDVVYRRMWPGIDARVSAKAAGIEYSFELAPGANPNTIRLRYAGADRVWLSAAGEVLLDAGGQQLADRAPVAFQRTGSQTTPVAARFVMRGGEIGFELGAYDRTRPLVIDPTLVYSTYLGGSAYDDGRAIAVDSTGAAYVTGTTQSSDFPTTAGAYQTTFRGPTNVDDAFVAKIDATGTRFDYVTYLGGGGSDEGGGIAVDTAGNAYVTGTTSSSDFPTTSGAFRTTKVSTTDGFLTKLNATGSSLVYSTFLGGDSYTAGTAVKVDAAGNAYVSGTTSATNLPVTAGAIGPPQTSGSTSAFLLKFNADASQVLYGTYLSGIGGSTSSDLSMAIDAGGSAFVAGTTGVLTGIARSQNGSPVQADANAAAFESTDGAQTFTPLRLPSRWVTGLAIDPQQPSTFYAATDDLVLSKSTDGGATWTSINNVFGASHGEGILVHPSSPSTLFARVATQSGNGLPQLFRSLDAGASWTMVLGGDVEAVVIAPSNPSVMYAVWTANYITSLGIVKSVDGGQTWTQVATTGGPALAVDPTNPSIVYFGTYSGSIFKSVDGGATWTARSVSPTRTLDLAINPTQPNTVWASFDGSGTTNGSVFRSSDGGVTWTQVAVALEVPSRMAFDGGTLYVSNNATFVNTSIARTTDNGTSWTYSSIRGNTPMIRSLTALNGIVLVGALGASDGFLYKINTTVSGSASIEWATYVGGNDTDSIAGVAVDPDGNAVVAVDTLSHDFPTATNAVRPTVVARVSADGTRYIVASYVGPNDNTHATGIAVDANGNAYVTGRFGTSDVGVWVDRVEPSGAETASFVLNGRSSGLGYPYPTPTDIPAGIAAGPTVGDVYIVGKTLSTDFPTTPNAPQPFYGSGASDAFISKVSFTAASAPYGGTPWPIPGTIEAENFDEGGQNVAYFDTTPGNAYGACRPTTDVDIETTTDVGGGCDVAKTKAGEWLKYTVNVTASGSYPLNVRVASAGAGATMHVEVDGVDQTGPIAVPNTGGWQTWTTVTTPGIALTAGQHVLRVSFDANSAAGGVGNFNWFRFDSASTPPPPPPPPPPPGNTPFGGTPAAVPGTFQAENFDEGGQNVAYFDTTSGNAYGACRPTTDVDIETTTDTGGGCDVAKTKAGEWLKYTVNVTASGSYPLNVRVASAGGGATMHVEVDGVDKTGPIAVPNTGGWQVWTTIATPDIALTAGTHVIRVAFDTEGSAGGVGNYNWFQFGSSTSPPPPGNTPFGGTPAAIPGTVEAENFDDGGQNVAYFDTTPGNAYGACRPTTDVDVEATADSGGGCDVAKTKAGEWLKYTVNVAASGSYPLSLRVANVGAGGSVHVEVDGVDQTGPIAVPDTGGWQTWTTITAPSLSLTAGSHVIRVSFDAAGSGGGVGNYNWFRVGS